MVYFGKIRKTNVSTIGSTIEILTNEKVKQQPSDIQMNS